MITHPTPHTVSTTQSKFFKVWLGHLSGSVNWTFVSECWLQHTHCFGEGYWWGNAAALFPLCQTSKLRDLGWCWSLLITVCSEVFCNSFRLLLFCYLISILCPIMKMSGKHLARLYKNHWANPWAGDDRLQFIKHLKLLIKWCIISVILRFYSYTPTTF